MQGMRWVTRTPAASTAAILSGLFDNSRTCSTPKKRNTSAGQVVIAEVGVEAELLVGLNGVGAVILEFVGAELIQ